MPETKLKPCPFCGGKVNAYKDNHNKCGIECPNCRMYFGIELEIACELMEGWHFTFDTQENMEEAWNKRISDDNKALEPNYEGDGYDDNGEIIYDMAYCPVCDQEYEVDYDNHDNYCRNCGQKLDWRRAEV